ncbi:DNRLRE domain-containing protein [Antarctobacter heliothermus]|uniref:Carbohydrate-binding module family 96 domain-containing protein n=1 Tax=Antarctobacter heliothermus TaxID=74033 RepID=A0A239JQE8_9RHOB|nr:DNRLRE domain-containing protein [Antarctobacter heliothermus]SNT07648.1 hypothetical protein SAMN04488078_105510 [Antarctobacter heliothermus]
MTGTRNAVVAVWHAGVRCLLGGVLALELGVGAAMAQPVLDAAGVEDFLIDHLANDLGLSGASVVIEDRAVLITLGFADVAEDEVVSKLASVLRSAGTAAHWSDTVHVTGHDLASTLFSMQVPTAAITAYVGGEITYEAYLSSWVIAGLDSPQARASAAPVVVAPSGDTHVYAYNWQGWHRANWGGYHVLGAGWHPAGGEKRSFLMFDLAGIDLDKVRRAELRLYHYHTSGDAAQSLGVFRVVEAWQEGRGTYQPGTPALAGETTWVRQPAFDPRPAARLDLLRPPERVVTVDVTALVQAWASGLPNRGLMLGTLGRPEPDTPEAMFGFYAREHPDPDKRPALVLYADTGASVRAEPAGPAHWVVIDGTISGDAVTDYELEFDGEIHQVDGTVGGHVVTETGDDRITGNRVLGRVGDGADGFRVTGTLRTLTLSAPEAARVVMDGKQIWAPVPASDAPGDYHEPARSSAERKAIIDAVRGPISAEIGTELVFDVVRLRSDATWAFVDATPLLPDGSPVDWAKTPFADAWAHGMMTQTVWALLYRDPGGWRVVDHVIGPTDVYWYGWVKQFGLPVAVFHEP